MMTGGKIELGRDPGSTGNKGKGRKMVGCLKTRANVSQFSWNTGQGEIGMS